MGCVIENRVRMLDGIRHGEYRLIERRPETSAATEFWQGPLPEQSGLALDVPKSPAGWRGDPEQGRKGRRA